ncbi:Lipopolysaccharide biosynthesis protein WzxC [Posidoniimonas polymericola]|uniref:Lipopolysaccharide biosynthesis protein WzxC n=1 Tax=Posidoniimonas polymericola TaxID=2528002 RepID=A0A5C5YHY7_9BACT|nr:lipopolysaccharide biosynthesis protein [Posidoniimonas polymericola]TWT73712.1 Lipopolysaccharide biosynthesis protein WzxC [Posidoniimonas polymericola]
MPSKVDYFCSDSIREDLKGKTVRGGVVSGVGQVIRIAIGLAAVPVLTRLLDPTAFGLLAMVAFFTNFAAMFVDAGMSMATVQREQISHRQVTNLFWISSGLGLAIAALAAAFSPAIAWFYGEPRLTAITCALALSYLLSGLAVQHQALLRRAMQFKELAIANVASMAVAQVAAVGWALRFRGASIDYWALVLIPLVTAAVRVAMLWGYCSWRPGWPAREKGTRSLVTFGANLTGFNFVNYFARNLDNLLIGWWWGGAALGYYDRAYRLMMIPLQQINSPLTGVVVPALSRLAGEPEKYRRAYTWTMERILLIACPMMAYAAVAAPWIAVVYLSEDFAESGPILQWLSVAAIWQTLSASVGWLFVSQGRDREMLRWGCIHSLLVAGSFVAGAPFGAIGVAKAYALVFNVACIPLAFWSVGRTGQVRVRDFLGLMWRVAPAPLAVAVTTVAVRLALPNATPMRLLLVSLLCAALAWAVAVLSTKVGRAAASELATSLRLAQARVRCGAWTGGSR